MSIRFANIPNLAELELTEVHGVLQKGDEGNPIKVAVQPEGGGRIIKEYAPSTPLSDIVHEIEFEGNSGVLTCI